MIFNPGNCLQIQKMAGIRGQDPYGSREVIITSRRLRSLIMEEEKLSAKIADLQARLEVVRKAKKLEEDSELLESIRSMELDIWDLYNLSAGIRDGEINMEMLRKVMAEGAKEKGGEEGSEGVLPVQEVSEDAVLEGEDIPHERRRGRKRKDSAESNNVSEELETTKEGNSSDGNESSFEEDPAAEAGREENDEKEE